MVSICRATGLAAGDPGRALPALPRSRPMTTSRPSSTRHHDRMTECRYPEPLQHLRDRDRPGAGLRGRSEEPRARTGSPRFPGISMDEWDRNLYYDYFVNKQGRNPTIVEIMDLNNANSEHSRHGFFKGRQVIDGEEMADYPVRSGHRHPDRQPARARSSPSRTTPAVIEGYDDRPPCCRSSPANRLRFTATTVHYHPLLTAETHNFPTGVAPFPGAETGTGGRIRDVQGTGRGGFVVAGTAGYCVGNLHIPGYELPWEERYPCPDNLAPALEIEIEASQRRLRLRQQVRRAADPGLHPLLRPAACRRRALGLSEADHVHRRHRPDRRPAHREDRRPKRGC